ncbi:Hpt domain-containing protein [Massilia sp. Mn16-1_5]|uniref:Hpt domain-containing protein n=1 Tax=Massilia sp. Mn16-1_5 TaxID=2079199 RepID=UPI001E453902|nr:Hpt domain-containing protein [Massilia sp. Mn16-1_5]
MTPHAPGPLSSSTDPTHAAPVLDIEAGVERLMGNRAIYLRALARFRHDYRKTVLAIRAALDAGNALQARRLAHTLKGAAGMIEAPALHTAALALETALRDGAGGIDALLARLDAALTEVLRELDGMVLPETETPPATQPASSGSLARLRAMLDIGDGAAVELVAAAHSELAAHLGQRGVEELSAAVVEFDYERALALLDRQDGAAGG